MFFTCRGHTEGLQAEKWTRTKLKPDTGFESDTKPTHSHQRQIPFIYIYTHTHALFIKGTIHPKTSSCSPHPGQIKKIRVTNNLFCYLCDDSLLNSCIKVMSRKLTWKHQRDCGPVQTSLLERFSTICTRCCTPLHISLLDLLQACLISLHRIQPFRRRMKNSCPETVDCPLLFKRSHSFPHLLVYADYLFRSKSALYKKEEDVLSAARWKRPKKGSHWYSGSCFCCSRLWTSLHSKNIN